MTDELRARFAEVWARADDLGDAALRDAIDAIAAEHPDDPLAIAERGGSRDSTGMEAEAERFYRDAIAAGLGEPELGQVTIQLASTLRNLGRAEESVTLLREYYAPRPEHELSAAASVFLALALHELGRHGEALAVTIRTIVPTLPRYTRSALAYADDLEADRDA